MKMTILKVVGSRDREFLFARGLSRPKIVNTMKKDIQREMLCAILLLGDS